MMGPRQVGKTVILEQLAHALIGEDWPRGNALYFNFADERVRTRAQGLELEDLGSFEPPGYRAGRPVLLLLDEIHLVPAWPNWLKRTVDMEHRRTSPRLRILATDSAASVLRQASVESGQGRWDEIRVLGLSFGEYLRFVSLGDESEAQAYDRRPAALEWYLSNGGYPATVSQEPSEDLRRAIREDIGERALRRDLLTSNPDKPQRIDVDRVRRLFVLLVQDSSSIWNAKARASDLEDTHPTSVSAWLQMLQDACLLHRVEPYLPSKGLPSAKRRLSATPKIHAADHGYIPAFTLDAYPMASQAVRARVTEAVVLRHLLELVSDRNAVQYYRERDSHREIDFVLRIGERLHAVEVTSSRHVDREKAARLIETANDIGADVVTSIHGGHETTHDGQLKHLALHRFLLNPHVLLEDSS